MKHFTFTFCLLLMAIPQLRAQNDSIKFYNRSITSDTIYSDETLEYYKLLDHFKNLSESEKKDYLNANANIQQEITQLRMRYLSLSIHEEAIPLMLLELEFSDTSKTNKIEEYLLHLNLLAISYEEVGDFPKALAIYQEIMEHYPVRKPRDPNFFTYAQNLVGIHHKMSNFIPGIELSLEIQGHIEDELGRQNEYYHRSLQQLDALYNATGNFDKSLAVLQEDLELNELQFGPSHINTKKAHYFLASQYLKMLDYQAALPLLLKVNTSFNSEDQHEDYYSGVLNNIATIYESLGQYKEAMEYYQRNLKFNLEYFGEKSGQYAHALNNIGTLYSKLGNHQLALDNFLQAFEIEKAENLESAFIIGNISDSYVELGQYDKAWKYLEGLMEIAEREKHKGKLGAVISAARYLGNYYYKIGKLPEALHWMETSRKELEALHGKANDEYALALSNQAFLNSELGNTDEAIALYKESLNIYESELGTNHSSLGSLLISLGLEYQKKSDFQTSALYFQKAIDNLLGQIELVFSFRNEAEKKNFLDTILYLFDIVHTLPAWDPGLDDIVSLNLNLQLTLKNLLLNSSKKMFDGSENIKDEDLKQKIQNLRMLKEMQANKNQSPFTIEEINITNELEEEIIKRYHEAFPNQKYRMNWEQIRDVLKPGEVVIEFAHFRVHEIDEFSDDVRYVAYVIEKGITEPHLHFLFEEKELERELEDFNINQLHGLRGAKGSRIKKKTEDDSSLYDLVWKPLEDYLKDAKTVYFSPTGLLHKIPFAALSHEEGKVLIEQYDLVQLSSSKALTEPTSRPKWDDNLFMGGINYNFKSPSKNSKTGDVTSTLPYTGSSTHTTSKAENWEYLPGTLAELKTIEKIFLKTGKTFSALEGEEATETAFKRLSGKSPSILHIATHGFFFENIEKGKTIQEQSKTVFKKSEDPLVRSGLLFAGANYAWNHGSNPEMEDDGILSALEISYLDLSNTDLVILSACETGLGDINGSEGVYGLQRSFKMAGVDILMMSLWEVPDAETAEFMALFYEYWLQEMPVRQAFLKTQRVMHSRYPKSPEKWAAFVLFQ